MTTPSNAPGLGGDMHRLIAGLYPICRSITGDGVRETLRRVQQLTPLEIREVPTGTPVFDWMVPPEWNIREAWIRDAGGRKVVDFRDSNLHVVSYSTPVRARMSLAELAPHLHVLPEHPDWIPYRTSYYKPTWGFCLSARQREAMNEGAYEVLIDSSLEPGSLTYGELHLPGELSDEILLSCHVCHPSLCNDNLSGVAVATYLARALAARRRRHSFRFLFIPGTIGSITWLALNEARVRSIRHGLVLSCLGDNGGFTYKRSRRGSADVDRAVEHCLAASGLPYIVNDFVPYGYDERQYCSPGFDLPVGCLTRTPNGKYPEYHTSADDLAFVRPLDLERSLAMCLQVLDVLEGNDTYRTLNPKCEPQLGRRGLYSHIGGKAQGALDELSMLWVLNQSDGSHSLLDIALRSGRPFADVRRAADLLVEHRLLEPVTSADAPEVSR
jgi:aminopeptidase-like protein